MTEQKELAIGGSVINLEHERGRREEDWLRTSLARSGLYDDQDIELMTRVDVDEFMVSLVRTEKGWRATCIIGGYGIVETTGRTSQHALNQAGRGISIYLRRHDRPDRLAQPASGA